MEALVHTDPRFAVVGERPAVPPPPSSPATWGAPVGVTVEHVVKAFGETPALFDVSLRIAPGELVALLGPSGSGKTTLLRVLAGLEFPTGGRVLFGDDDALGLSVQDRHIGFVFQSYALFKSMRVFDNIAFGLRARPSRTRPSRSAIRDRVMRLLELVQLAGLEDRYPSQLSGGQRQRVALARALAIEPRVLLLDEPFGALDSKVRRELRRWLRELHEETGHTTVFVTHDQEEAIELADRIVVLNRGRIEQVGTPDEIYDRPASAFVAGFIGESTMLPTRLEDGRLFLDDRSLDIPVNGDDGPRTLVFRPHDVELVGDRPGAIAGRVVAERRHGASRRLDVEIGLRRHRVEVDVPAGYPQVDKGNRITFLPNRWWLFAA